MGVKNPIKRQNKARVRTERTGPKPVKAPGCRWFALCSRKATGTTPHPVLGDVPTCDRCHRFATGEDRGQ